MRFGVVLDVTASYADWDTFLNIAEEAERLGYDSIWVSDHFISPSGARAARALTRLRNGSMLETSTSNKDKPPRKFVTEFLLNFFHSHVML